jgi:hypothetical protein
MIEDKYLTALIVAAVFLALAMTFVTCGKAVDVKFRNTIQKGVTE